MQRIKKLLNKPLKFKLNDVVSYLKYHKFQVHKELIEQSTKVSTQHLTPEIKLHLITKETSVWNEKINPDYPHPLGDPYWAFYWPGGQAVSRLVLKAIKRVLCDYTYIFKNYSPIF